MEYYFKTDFQIVETFTDSTGVPIDLNDFDFELIYQTTGVYNYKAFKKGEVLINCSIDTVDSSKLIVVFQNHKLSCGQLHREIKIKALNPLFEDYQQIMTHPFTEIYLVQNGGDQTTGYASAGIPIVLPYSETIVTDLADTDYFFGMSLSLKSFIKITWLDIKAKLKTYFDTLFEPKNSNIQSHISDTGIHVTSGEKSNFHSHSNKSDLDNVSGNNTGDETAQTIKNKLGITTLSGSNTGDQSASNFDIKDLTDSTNLRSTWNAKQDALSADVDYLTPTTASTTYEPKKGENDNYVTDDEKTVIENTSGENTGDETAESIIDKIGTDGQIKSDYLPSLDYSTNIEADKASTTKISAIKTFYDWAVAKFLLATKLVTSWSATPTHDNIPSEKLVKDSLNLKADITPANGSTSALRALFTSVPNSGCVYNSTTGYYEMNGITNLTEAQLLAAYPIVFNSVDFRGKMLYIDIRTNFPVQELSYTDLRINLSLFMLKTTLEVFAFRTHPVYGNKIYVSSLKNSFRFCDSLKKILGVLDVSQVTDFSGSFYSLGAFEQIELLGLKANIAFAGSPLLNLYTLQYMVTNRANGTTRITITVHATVWGYLNDAVGHPEWNALLVDAVANQYIDFARA